MKKCHDCGHEHPTMAQAGRNVHREVDPPGAMISETRYFCHENDHSCYQGRYGKYWDDETPRGTIRAERLIREALEKLGKVI